MFPPKRGFYVRDTQGWEPLISVPCDHLCDYAKYAVLRRDVCYVDEQCNPHVATIGLPFDGLSIPWILQGLCGGPWGHNLCCGVIHDSDCAIATSYPCGRTRDHMVQRADGLFREMLEYNGNPAIVPPAWKTAVRIGYYAKNRYRAVVPDYRLDLRGYYEKRGMLDIYPWVADRIARHAPVASFEGRREIAA